MDDKVKQSSGFQNLWDRRFFQFGATYIGVGWALIQFTEWMTNRYDLSPNLVEKIILFLLIMLPAVLIFIYNHGRAGDDEWKPYEKYLLSGSLLFGFLASGFFFNGATGNATEVVSLTNEAGETITREVPKTEFTKQVVIFPFQVSELKQEDSWKGLAAGFLVDKDIEQDMRIFSINPFSLFTEYQSYNVEFPKEIPFSTALKIAQDNYSNYFVQGKMEEKADSVSLHIKIFETNSGEEYFKNVYKAENLYIAVDQFTKDFSENIYLPDAKGTIEFLDLPSSDLISSNIESLENFIQGMLIKTLNPGTPQFTSSYFLNAINMDGNCAECYSEASLVLIPTGQDSLGKAYAEKALDLSGALPERQQMRLKLYNYLSQNVLVKGIKLCETWMKLYPMDKFPYQFLINYYRQILEWDKAKAIGEKALENGQKGAMLTTVADLFVQTGELDKAEKYLLAFNEAHPHKAKESVALGDLLMKQGKLNQALDFFDEKLVLLPNNLDIKLKAGTVNGKLGKFIEEEEIYDEALRKAKTVQDSISIYANRELLLHRLGKMDECFNLMEKRAELTEKISVKRQALVQLFFTGMRYVQAGKEKKLREKLDELVMAFEGNNPALWQCLTKYLYADWTENLQDFKESTAECGSMLMQSGGKNMVYVLQARQNMIEGNIAEAIKNYETYVDSTGAAEGLLGQNMCKLYRLNRDFEKAENFIENLLKEDPNEPLVLLEKAQLLNDRKKPKKSEKVLNHVLQIWAAADENYKPYQEALALKNSISVN